MSSIRIFKLNMKIQIFIENSSKMIQNMKKINFLFLKNLMKSLHLYQIKN